MWMKIDWTFCEYSRCNKKATNNDRLIDAFEVYWSDCIYYFLGVYMFFSILLYLEAWEIEDLDGD